jgi:DNA-binding MarR family transcriptional regulator
MARVTTNDPLVAAFLAVSRSMVAIAARNLATQDADVTLPQYRTLVALAGRGPQRSAVLARELGVAPSTLTRMCDRLVRKALIHRFHRHSDRRSIWLGLTPAGRDLVGLVMRARRNEIAAVVRAAGLTAGPAGLTMLAAFVQASGELADEEWWRRWESSADPVDDAQAMRASRLAPGVTA